MIILPDLDLVVFTEANFLKKANKLAFASTQADLVAAKIPSHLKSALLTSKLLQKFHKEICKQNSYHKKVMADKARTSTCYVLLVS